MIERIHPGCMAWLAGAAWCALLAGCQTTPVFRAGRALLPVIVAAGAPPEERAAAQELGRVLGRMSGLAWPVRPAAFPGERGLYVGAGPGAAAKSASDLLAPKAGEAGPDSFRIQSRAGSVFIAGATPEATGFAVAWLLQEQAGVRWYAPGPLGEVIPVRREWSLPSLHIARSPAYVSREIYGPDTAQGTDWARRNGLRGRLEYNHALTRMFPLEILAEHPDWAPELRGRRYQPVAATDGGWQPNLALPAVAAHAAQVAAAMFVREPARPSVSLAINDTLRFDESAATRELVGPLRYFRGNPDYSPLVFTFMNRAAEQIAAGHPDRYLGCLAYFWCENPPPFRVHPQVVPYVTTDRSQYYDPTYRAADLALMTRWGASGVRAFGLWEYAEGGNFLVPRQPLDALAGAVREGWHRGARGYFAECWSQPGFDAFKAWLLARLLWEPDRSPAELADDFFHGYYGNAAGPMRRFFARCEAQWMAQPGPPYWLKLYRQEDQALLFPLEICRELRGLLDAAGQVVEGPEAAARVGQTARAFAVTEAYVRFDAERRKLAALVPDETAAAPVAEAGVAESIRQLLNARAGLQQALTEACSGENPAMSPIELAPFVRNDPVPRLLWLAAQRDSAAARRILAATGPGAAGEAHWALLAESLAAGDLAAARNQTRNPGFLATTPSGQEPEFLFPRSGALPAEWEVRAAPTEKGSVALSEAGPAGRTLRIEGAWDTQVFQWLVAAPGRAYVATAQLRGRSGSGGDAALFLTFLSAAGEVVGTHRMQSLPKGLTAQWRTAVLADRAPENAAWIGVGFGASRQTAGDWLEVRAAELRDAAEAAP